MATPYYGSRRAESTSTDHSPWRTIYEMNADTVLVRNPDVVEAEVDGQRVLMSPKDYSYFGLVGTGALVWDRIDNTMTVAQMASALAQEFSTPEDTVLTDVSEFVSALNAAGLLAS